LAPVYATVEEAVAVLRRGGLVGFPTETVYGLGADARNPEALEKLYKVKGRPARHPVIVHLAEAAEAHQWAREIPDYASKLAAVFWPGPLTLVLKRAEGVPDAVTGGQDTVGLRIPSHPVAQELLRTFGGAIAAPSANRYGRVSPTTAAHVLADLGADVDAVLDGGPSEVGIESTIVVCSGEQPAVLRPGKITAAQVEAAAELLLAAPGESAPRVPGTAATHYAPRAKLRLLKRTEMIAALTTHKGKRIAALALEVAVPRLPAGLLAVEPAVAATYMRELYSNLRMLDAAGADVIIVEIPPDTPAWAGVLDRLRRAAAA
jgi:L-threonylcarbamoyladenylate synthase